jgi:hypothetical protein
MARIIDAASIYTAAAAVFAYARRRDEQLPHNTSWDAIRNALMFNMHIWSDQHQAMLSRREANSTPFMD